MIEFIRSLGLTLPKFYGFDEKNITNKIGVEFVY